MELFSHHVSIARSMLLHQKKRFLLSLSAIAFTVMIMFMEMGFFNGINDSQSRLATQFNADMIMMDKKSVHLNKFDKMDRIRLNQAFAFDEVVDVVPIYKGNISMKNPDTGLTKVIFVLAFPPGSDPLNISEFDHVKEQLKKQGTVLFDRKSRKIYGSIKPGQFIEINRVKYHVGGLVEMGPNFSIDGTLLMSDATWLWGRYTKGMDRIAYGLIRTEPGTDIQALKAKMIERLPGDIIILTPEEMRKREVLHTIKAVPLGAIFGVGMVIGFIIGVIICYQILYNEITDHLPQYATLRAMGFDDRYLTRVVIQEAVWLSILGFIPGFACAWLIYYIIEYFTGILMFFTLLRVGIIFFVTILMCIAAARIAVKRVLRVDPADLY